jgi:hypothetical protein|tara:strand:+ start:115 stop:522 length:408 start_codon:yes stop_codon:yes gene_type:complete
VRHILIILISILLLSSPVIGDSHKGETLYRWDTSTDIWDSVYVWKGFGDKDFHPVYKGDVKNGVPNGLGIMIYTSGSKYVGGWKNGKKHGKGQMTHTDRSSEWGEYKDGVFWNGTFYDENGNIGKKRVNGKTMEQ